MSIERRARWHPPPPPTARILRRPRRKPTNTVKSKPKPQPSNTNKGNLESFFDRERIFAKTVPIDLLNSEGSFCNERRQRVLEDRDLDNAANSWRFQAEILRAECNFLRMERDLAMKKLELYQIQMKKSSKCSPKSTYRDQETNECEENFTELGNISSGNGTKTSNFDQKALILRRRLEKLSEEEKCVSEIREMTEASLTIKTTSSCRVHHHSNTGSSLERRFTDVENLRKKMERLSKVMLEMMKEEYGSMLLSSTTSSASSSKHIEHLNSASSSTYVPQNHQQESKSREAKACSGRCKTIIRKIVEQVQAEMEQWSEMQEMVGLVREEMEELRVSHDLWENKARSSDKRVESLKLSVQEWKEKAFSRESKVNELQHQISDYEFQIKALKTRKYSQQLQQIPRETQKEKEKRVLICSLKDNQPCRTRNNIRSKEGLPRGDGNMIIRQNGTSLRDISNLSSSLS